MYNINDFYNATPDEIDLVNDSLTEVFESDLHMCYTLADNISAFVSLRLNGKDIPKFETVYPSTDTQEVSQETKKAIYEDYKNQLINFAKRHNKGGK